MIRAVHPQTIGISAIAIYEPPWMLWNDWFSDILPRKFVQHTGILSRHISMEDEVAIGIRAVENLQREVNCDLQDCVAVVFVSPSIVHGSIARQYLDKQQDWLKSTNRAAREFVRRLGIPAANVYGINWGCSGYSKALSIVRRHILPSLRLRQNQFVMVVTASRISRITDYGCKQTAPLFGDLATVTILSPIDSEKYPVHFDLIFAGAGMRPAESVFFDYHLLENVVVPTPEGGEAVPHVGSCSRSTDLGLPTLRPVPWPAPLRRRSAACVSVPKRYSFSSPSGRDQHRASHGNEIGGDRRPRRSDQWVDKRRRQRQFVLRSLCLTETWNRLRGTIVCPTAGVGHPGDAEVSQGCIILQATESHH